MNRFFLVLAPLISVCSPALAAPGVAPSATQPDGQIILATGSQWWAYAMCGPGQIATEFAAGAATRLDLDGILGKVPRTSPPPDNWAAPDAGPATSCWTRSPGPIDGLPRGCEALYLRGLFTVTDPARVRRLTLWAAYRGGIIVYLNGREVARKDLPAGPGSLAPDTQALPFPVEAYLDSAGEAREQHVIDLAIRNGDKDLAARVATRDRTLGPVELPMDGLRQGTNVLAIEIHRSGYRPEVAKWSKREQAAWTHLRWTALRLSAAGDGIQPNVARPAQLQVWNRDIHDVFSTDDYGDPNVPVGPIRMVGPRNGCCSGQVVVGSPRAALDQMRAACADLVEQDGKARIPATQVEIFCPSLTTIEYSIRLDGIGIPKYLPVPAFGILLDHPPEKIAVAAMKTDAKERAALGLPAAIVPAAVQPVWITVRIPKDAAPGLYRGTLDLSSAGNVLAWKVPVELEVVDWVMPEPKDAVTTMALNQSPETLAVQYGVEQWSDRHWQLMAKSYQLLGQARNNLLVIPLVCRTQYGNDDCYLPWVRQADGGGQPYQFDFTVHDRLIELAKKYFDLRVISYQVYLSNGWNKVGPDKPTFVTVVDQASGKRERMQLPAYGSEESRKLFKPLIEQIKQHLAKLGIGEGTRIVLGVCQDAGIHKTVVEHFKLLWPEATWHYGSHNRPSAYRSTAKMFGYSEYLYVQPIPPTAAGRRYGWKEAPLTLMSQRVYGVKQVPLIVRTMPERALVRGDNGAGRMCLDYWPVQPDKQGRKSWLYDRWPDSSCDQRSPCLRCLAQPGPDGPVASSKLAVLREGLQEAEARIVLERALADKRITGQQAEKVQSLLDRRVEELRAFDYLWGNGTLVDVRTSYSVGWQASSAELLKTAAEVVRTTGGK